MGPHVKVPISSQSVGDKVKDSGDSYRVLIFSNFTLLRYYLPDN